jgi:hypothetical protein
LRLVGREKLDGERFRGDAAGFSSKNQPAPDSKNEASQSDADALVLTFAVPA